MRIVLIAQHNHGLCTLLTTEPYNEPLALRPLHWTQNIWLLPKLSPSQIELAKATKNAFCWRLLKALWLNGYSRSHILVTGDFFDYVDKFRETLNTCIGGSEEHYGRATPFRSNFFSISCSFRGKFAKIVDWRIRHGLVVEKWTSFRFMWPKYRRFTVFLSSCQISFQPLLDISKISPNQTEILKWSLPLSFKHLRYPVIFEKLWNLHPMHIICTFLHALFWLKGADPWTGKSADCSTSLLEYIWQLHKIQPVTLNV